MKKYVLVSLVTLASLISSAAFAVTQNVDVNDLIQYSTDSDDAAISQEILSVVNSNPAKLGVSSSLRYSSHGLSALSSSGIYSIDIQDYVAKGGKANFNLYVMYFDGGRAQLNKVPAELGKSGLSFGAISKFDLGRNPVKVQLDVFNRQVMVTEPTSGLKKYYPLAVGSLTHNQLGDATSGYHSLSPGYTNAYLGKAQSEVSRTYPDYYKGRPFLRIVNRDQADYGGFTPFGIHYQIADTFQRGFISNGCFRLRDNDLYELGTLLFSGDGDQIDLTIINNMVANNKHPLPQINDWYNTPEVGPGPSGYPVYLKNEHNLFIFDQIFENPVKALLGR